VFGLANLALPSQLQSILGVDYLLLVVAFLAFVVFFRLNVSLNRLSVWGIPLLIACGSLPGFLIAEPTDYGNQKLQTLVIIVIVFAAAGSVRQPDLSVIWFGRLALTVAVFFSFLLLFVSTVAENGRVSVFDLNPVGVARLASLSSALALTYFMYDKSAPINRKVALLALGIVGFTATVLTGSRGPLLSAFIALLAVLVVLLNSNVVHPIWLLLFAGSAIGFSALGWLDINSSTDWVTGREYSGRDKLYTAAIDSILSSPLGIGWGNFGSLYGVGSSRIYPHNIYLEVAVEGGVIALLTFLSVTVWALIVAFQRARESRLPSDLISLALYVYALVNAQLSSDLVGNRLLWVSLAFVVAVRAANLVSPVRAPTLARSDK
jgi:O-antigen ligase